jgi:tetratricopeptide (TPR) repeat protein
MDRYSHIVNPQRPSLPTRIVAAAMIAALICPLFLLLLHRLDIQLTTIKAASLIEKRSAHLAVELLENTGPVSDRDFRMQLGHAYFHAGELAPTANDSYLFYNKALIIYNHASQLSPLDADIAFYQAKVAQRLDQLYSFRHPKSTTTVYDPIGHLKRALVLRPNGLTYHFFLAKILYEKGGIDELSETVNRLCSRYPIALSSIKKEVYWSLPKVKDACVAGLQSALKNNIMPRTVLLALSELAEERHEWSKAVNYLEDALTIQPELNTGYHSIQRGRLYLSMGDEERARFYFIDGLAKMNTPDKELNAIFVAYIENGHSEQLISFYYELKARIPYLQNSLGFLVQSLIQLNKLDTARSLLFEINRKKTQAEAYYWLARIAAKQKDLDAMQIAAQKATILSPQNSNYHLMYSKILNRLHKYDQAENAASMAIKHDLKPGAPLFAHRARLRERLDLYGAALKDWQTAIRLKPKDASFHARAAEAAAKIGRYDFAREYFKIAIELAPKNSGYQKRYTEIAGRLPK